MNQPANGRALSDALFFPRGQKCEKLSGGDNPCRPVRFVEVQGFAGHNIVGPGCCGALVKPVVGLVGRYGEAICRSEQGSFRGNDRKQAGDPVPVETGELGTAKNLAVLGENLLR